MCLGGREGDDFPLSGVIQGLWSPGILLGKEGRSRSPKNSKILNKVKLDLYNFAFIFT